MGDFVRDVGLKYADSVPLALGVLIAPLAVIAWLAYWVYENKDLEDDRTAIFVGLAVAALFFIVQVPAAYTQAKSHCEDLWAEAEGPLIDTTVDISVDTSYISAGCHNVWPTGP